MPEIDLPPHEYGSRDPQTGKLRKEMSPHWHRNWFFVVLVMVGYVVWNRSVIGPDTLLGAGLMLGLLAGIAFHGWLRKVY